MNQLAIVIPYYKINYFEETLKSLANQTDKRFTLYIGNDASPHDPLPLIKTYFKDQNFQYFNYDDNLGGTNLVLQWERILNNATEEWFQILGDDDTLAVDFVESFYVHYAAYSTINVVKFKSEIFDIKNNEKTTFIKTTKSGNYDAFEFMIQRFSGSVNSSLSEHIFRRSSYEAIGFIHYPLAWASDDMLFLQMTDLNSYYYNSEGLVTIKVFEESISGSANNIALKQQATIQFFRDLSKLVSTKQVSLSLRLKFLKSLRGPVKQVIGLQELKQIHYEQGIIPRSYYWVYKIWLILKQINFFRYKTL